MRAFCQLTETVLASVPCRSFPVQPARRADDSTASPSVIGKEMVWKRRTKFTQGNHVNTCQNLISWIFFFFFFCMSLFIRNVYQNQVIANAFPQKKSIKTSIAYVQPGKAQVNSLSPASGWGPCSCWQLDLSAFLPKSCCWSQNQG